MLPAISGNCPVCRSEEIIVLSRSRATNETYLCCESCGEDWWEGEEPNRLDSDHDAWDEKVA